MSGYNFRGGEILGDSNELALCLAQVTLFFRKISATETKDGKVMRARFSVMLAHGFETQRKAVMLEGQKK